MSKIKRTKAERNYLVDIIAFLPFFLLLLTGLVLLAYHGGKAVEELTLGLDGHSWMTIHRVLTVIAVPIVLLHLLLHFDWIKKLFTFKLKNKYKGINITLFILFLITMSTSLISWLFIGEAAIGDLLRGLHNKFGLLLIIFFVIHISVYTKWLVKMTKRFLGK